MILLVAAATALRTALALQIEAEGFSIVTADTFTEAIDLCTHSVRWLLVICEYRIGDSCVSTFLARPPGPPLVVLGAPLRSECELLRQGATLVLRTDYSISFVALQCVTLVRALQLAATPALTSADFPFGTVVIRRQLRAAETKMASGQRATLPLTKLQMQLIEAFCAAPRQILDYEFLMNRLWHRRYTGDNAVVREANSTLRKLFTAAGLPYDRWVVTVSGRGLRYDPPP